MRNDVQLEMQNDLEAGNMAVTREIESQGEGKTIFELIPKIMGEVGHIAKARRAAAGSGMNYSFRGIDDVYFAVQPLLAKHGVFVTPEVLEDRSEERESRSGTVLIYRILKVKYSIYAADGSSVTAVMTGEGMDTGDKASNKAMSAAYKYLFLQLFCIPTEEQKDSEYENHEVKPKIEAAKDIPDGYTGKILSSVFFNSGMKNNVAWKQWAIKVDGHAPMFTYDEKVYNTCSAAVRNGDEIILSVKTKNNISFINEANYKKDQK